MVKLLKRVSDNKYLKSAENDLWVDNFSEAFEMTYIECENMKVSLSNTYGPQDLKEIINISKVKPSTRQEIKELRDLLKNN